ncbi:MAG: FAD-dependent oxidoreductase [Cetobacterium sp.]|nr:FAD-dependent oxidoreductase [Cetobacterium sp.]
MESNIYDLIIIGAGPAGLSAAIYAGRANLKVLVIEKEKTGSLIIAHKIDNYPGFPEGITGEELYEKMKNQAKKYNVHFKNAIFLGFDIQKDKRVIKTNFKNYITKSIIIASGWTKNNNSKIKGENEFIGKGVSYCANCDGAFTKNLVVGVFGDGEEAKEEASFLSRYAKEVRLFTNVTLKEIKGKEFVETVEVEEDGKINSYELDYVFLYLGTKNITELYTEVATLNPQGYIKTDENMKTDIEGIFAAGDIREKNIRQVSTAISDGTIAAMGAIKYIAKNKK